MDENRQVLEMTPNESNVFLQSLRKTVRDFLSDFSRSLSGHSPPLDEASYVATLCAMYGVTIDSQSVIDWSLLEDRRLISAEERHDEEMALARCIESLGGLVGEATMYRAAIAPTFGISLGMLYSLCEATRVACGIERALFVNKAGYGVDFVMFFSSRRGHATTLQKRLSQWILNHPLSTEERREAIFAASAFNKFVERHFSEKMKTPLRKEERGFA